MKEWSRSLSTVWRDYLQSLLLCGATGCLTCGSACWVGGRLTGCAGCAAIFSTFASPHNTCFTLLFLSPSFPLLFSSQVLMEIFVQDFACPFFLLLWIVALNCGFKSCTELLRSAPICRPSLQSQCILISCVSLFPFQYFSLLSSSEIGQNSVLTKI